LISSITKQQMIHLNTLLLILDCVAMPFFGWLSSKISRDKMMISAAFGVLLTTIPLFILLESATLTSVILVRICLVLFGVAFFAPFHAWAQDLVPQAHRYAIISFGYAIGSQLLGGPSAAFSLWLFKTTGIISSISWYWLTLAAITCFSLTRAFISKGRTYDENLNIPILKVTKT
ncbi:MAG: MFS transporter, partial [Parachlamydiaceae bacterium]